MMMDRHQQDWMKDIHEAKEALQEEINSPRKEEEDKSPEPIPTIRGIIAECLARIETENHGNNPRNAWEIGWLKAMHEVVILLRSVIGEAE